MLRLLASFTCLVCAALSPSAFALSTYCVDTTAELDSALAQTQDDDVRVNLVQGNYDMRNTRLAGHWDMEASLMIVGGYTGGCSSRSYNAALTSLFADTSTQINFGSGADITLAVLTFRDFELIGLSATDIGAISTGDHDLRLDRVAFLSGYGVYVNATNTYVKQVAVTNGLGECAFRVESEGLDLVQIENSLFANNAEDGFCIGHDGTQARSWGSAAIYNSIFWNNGGDDVWTISTESQSDLALRYNILQGTSIAPPSSIGAVGTLNADPQFVNAAAGDFRIGNASPARDTGSTAIPDGVPTTDIQGLQRIVSSTIDRGPYENQSAGALFNYTVTNTNDTGSGSLRQALLDAEATAGLNGIVFNIPGAGCPKVIDVESTLPEITQPLYLDGLSQPGSSGNNSEVLFNATLCILLRDAAGVAKGLVVADAAPTSTAVTIKGLGFSGFSTAAIDLRGGSGHFIMGNRFAGSMGAYTLDSGSYAIRVARSDPPLLRDVQIGGDDPNQRNLVGGADGFGIVLIGDQVRDTLVINNFVGLAANGIGANPNAYGIVNVGAIDTTIRDNWVSGNEVDGILLNGSDAYVTGNHVGVAPVGGALGNGGWGVRLNYNLAGGGNANNVVGSGISYFLGLPIPVGAGNTIAHNVEGGIRVDGGLGHRLSRNIVYANGRPEIDIASDGFTFNNNDADPGATDLGNRGLNYPTWAGSQGGGHTRATLHATFASTNGTYRIEVYSSPACYGSGLSPGGARFYHGATSVAIGNAPPGQNGSVAFDYVLKAAPGATPLDDRGIVMLAIDADGNSSELSLCAAYQYSDVIFADNFE